MSNEKVKFSELEIGQEFECYGDELCNYDYPKICNCIKTGIDNFKEYEGCNFLINPTSYVFIKSDKGGVKE